MTVLSRARHRVRDGVLGATVGAGIRLRARVEERDAERGDVPGWVLITLMTAGIVTVLWTVAEDQLVGLFQDAMNQVRGR